MPLREKLIEFLQGIGDDGEPAAPSPSTEPQPSAPPAPAEPPQSAPAAPPPAPAVEPSATANQQQGYTQEQMDAAIAKAAKDAADALAQQLRAPATPPVDGTGSKSVWQKMVDGDPVSNEEIDAAYDKGEITKIMSDTAGSRTEVRV